MVCLDYAERDSLKHHAQCIGVFLIVYCGENRLESGRREYMVVVQTVI